MSHRKLIRLLFDHTMMFHNLLIEDANRTDREAQEKLKDLTLTPNQQVDWKGVVSFADFERSLAAQIKHELNNRDPDEPITPDFDNLFKG